METQVTTKQPVTVNLAEVWSQDEVAKPTATMEIVRLSADETAVVVFTPNAAPVKLHYVESGDAPGYVRCNGADRALCRAGKHAEDRVLLPVFVPATKKIAILAIPSASRPGSLRPQIMPALRSKEPVVLLIHKPDRMTFRVRMIPLADGMEDGAAAIKEFMTRYGAGGVDLAEAYLRMSNDEMEKLPGVALMMKLTKVENRERD